jgi:cell wall-associated NlpC family hydrolase/chitodextrinase
MTSAPDPVSVPDDGSRPAATGELRLPGAPPNTLPSQAVPVPGPLSQQILAAETEVGVLGERLKGLDEQLATAHDTVVERERSWRAAAGEAAALREKADNAATDAYKTATGLGPFSPIGTDLRQFGRLVPGQDDDTETGPEAAARELARADADEQAKYRMYSDALIVEQGLTGQRTTLFITFEARQAALVKLKQDNAAQLARIEAEQDAFERSQASRYGQVGVNASGEAANPRALAAVRFALSQLGKAYEWGAEGPDHYDCSGLMWASYRSVGISTARVAKDQYHTTTPISVDQLLPGDLVFFATDRFDWTTVHHVGMYIGDGKMVHSPTTGEVVKISNVWWSRFFGATRVVPAIPAPPPVTTPPVATPPTVPGSLTSPARTGTSIVLNWAASTASGSIAGYNIYRNGSTTPTGQTTGTGTMFTDTGLAPSTTYTYVVRARDAAGRLSGPSNEISATTNDSPPTAPGTLTSTAKTETSIALSWAASTDTGGGLAGYNIYRDGAAEPIAQTTDAGTTFNDTGLSAGTTHTYVVRARDATGHLSGPSSELSVTTDEPAPPPTPTPEPTPTPIASATPTPT